MPGAANKPALEYRSLKIDFRTFLDRMRRPKRPGAPGDRTACAQVAELVDALASGASGRKVVEVRVLSWAPSLRCSIPAHPQRSTAPDRGNLRPSSG